jgi:hypothetical protein
MRPTNWEFRCDFGHVWDVPEEAPGVEPLRINCPDCGQTAITATRRPPADRVHFQLEPAAVVTDAVRGSVVNDGQYYVEIHDASGEWTATTPDPISLDKTMRLLGELSKCSAAEAIRKAKRMGLT